MPRHTPSLNKPKKSKATFKRMVRDFKPELPLIIAIIVLSILSSIFLILGPLQMNTFFQNIGELHYSSEDDAILRLNWGYLLTNFGIMLGYYLASALIAWLADWLAVNVSSKFAFDERQKIKLKIDKLPLSYFDRVPYGQTLNNGTNDVDNISRNLQNIITQLFSGVTMFLGSVIAMFIVSPIMAAVTLCSLPIIIAIVALIGSFSQKQFKNYRGELSQLNGLIEENYAGYKIIKLFSKEKHTIDTFNKTNDKMTKADRLSQFLSGLIFPTTNFVNNLAFVAIAVTAGLLGVAGEMVVFFSLLRLFTSPFQQVGQIINVIQSVLASQEKIYNLLDEKEEEADVIDAIDDEEVIKGQYSFNDVAFSYSKEKPLISHMNLNVKQGDSIAIVGPTGAGKTTIVNLLMRFYEINTIKNQEQLITTELDILNEMNSLLNVPAISKDKLTVQSDLPIKEQTANAINYVKTYYDELLRSHANELAVNSNLQKKLDFIIDNIDYRLNNGAITLDGNDLCNYTRKTLRGAVGMVLQDTWLFNGTIRDNVKYGNPEATDEEMIAACREAHVYHFIQTLPDGFDFVLNEEGGNISQGQKQLLTIARAILSKPKILILDEATSSVDTRTEKAIQDAMNKIMVNRTSFVIAHRLSTIKNAKLILVMQKGHIIEQGTHEELLAKKGFYEELYNAQFLGTLDNDSQEDKTVLNS